MCVCVCCFSSLNRRAEIYLLHFLRHFSNVLWSNTTTSISLLLYFYCCCSYYCLPIFIPFDLWEEFFFCLFRTIPLLCVVTQMRKTKKSYRNEWFNLVLQLIALPSIWHLLIYIPVSSDSWSRFSLLVNATFSANGIEKEEYKYRKREKTEKKAAKHKLLIGFLLLPFNTLNEFVFFCLFPVVDIYVFVIVYFSHDSSWATNSKKWFSFSLSHSTYYISANNQRNVYVICYMIVRIIELHTATPVWNENINVRNHQRNMRK